MIKQDFDIELVTRLGRLTLWEQGHTLLGQLDMHGGKRVTASCTIGKALDNPFRNRIDHVLHDLHTMAQKA